MTAKMTLAHGYWCRDRQGNHQVAGPCLPSFYRKQTKMPIRKGVILDDFKNYLKNPK